MPNVLLAAAPAMFTRSTAMLICVAVTPGALPGGDTHEGALVVAVEDLFAVTPAELGALPPAAGAVVAVVVDVALAVAPLALATDPPTGAVVPRPTPRVDCGAAGNTAHIRADNVKAAAATELTFWATVARRNQRRKAWNGVISASSTTLCFSGAIPASSGPSAYGRAHVVDSTGAGNGHVVR